MDVPSIGCGCATTEPLSLGEHVVSFGADGTNWSCMRADGHRSCSQHFAVYTQVSEQHREALETVSAFESQSASKRAAICAKFAEIRANVDKIERVSLQEFDTAVGSVLKTLKTQADALEVKAQQVAAGALCGLPLCEPVDSEAPSAHTSVPYVDVVVAVDAVKRLLDDSYSVLTQWSPFDDSDAEVLVMV
jgi:hypothetical protein